MDPEAHAANGWTHIASDRPMKISSRVLGRSGAENMPPAQQELHHVLPADAGRYAPRAAKNPAAARRLSPTIETFGADVRCHLAPALHHHKGHQGHKGQIHEKVFPSCPLCP